MNNKNSIKVSVIVPTYNAEKLISLCLDALAAQNYSMFEIIVVDNGSQDSTCDIVSKYTAVQLCYQNNVQSSYAARNIGIAHATGQLLAFTDADCIPDSNWLSNAVTSFEKNKCDMLGGNIDFFYSEKPSGAELLDSLINMQNHQYISMRGVAITANLFVKKNIFHKVGMFQEVTSGGDVMFTGNAVKNGYSLIYANNVIVKHPTRKLRELLIKSWRTGTAAIDIHNSTSPFYIINLIKELFFVSLVPPNPFKWAKKVSALPIKTNYFSILSTVLSLYLVKLVAKLAAIVALSSRS